jgi:hypothetical protein
MPYYPAVWGYPYAFGGYGGYGNFNSTNLLGSAVANNSLINTGSVLGVTQTATPTVIW